MSLASLDQTSAESADSSAFQELPATRTVESPFQSLRNCGIEFVLAICSTLSARESPVSVAGIPFLRSRSEDEASCVNTCESEDQER